MYGVESTVSTDAVVVSVPTPLVVSVIATVPAPLTVKVVEPVFAEASVIVTV